MADNNQQNNQQNAPAEDVGRLRQVRRDKLAELQAQGKTPHGLLRDLLIDLQLDEQNN